jgi:hypothetical protein
LFPRSAKAALVLVLSAAVLVLSAAVLVLSAAVLVLSAAVLVLSAAVLVLSAAVLVLSAAVLVLSESGARAQRKRCSNRGSRKPHSPMDQKNGVRTKTLSYWRGTVCSVIRA